MLAHALLAVLAIAPQKPIVDIGFDLVGNRIYLPAKLGNRDLHAIFDTGAGGSAVDLGLADELKLPGDQRVMAGGVGTNQVTGRILTDAKLVVGDQAHNVPYAIPFASLNSAEGRKMELILGYDFISQYVFQIDYAQKRMRIYPSGTKLTDLGTEIPMRIVGGHPHIRTKISLGGQTHDIEAMIDSGATQGGLTGRFTKAVPIPSNVKATSVTTIGGGVGGFVTGRFIRLDSITLGGFEAKNPVVSVNESGGGANGTGANYDLLLGAEVLKRFTFTIDYPNNKVYFKPNSDFGKPFEADKSGIRLTSSGPDLRQYSIIGILPSSSSEAAGLKAGDKLVSVDGVLAETKSLQEWREFFRSPAAKAWEIVVERKGEKVKAKVEARSVI